MALYTDAMETASNRRFPKAFYALAIAVILFAILGGYVTAYLTLGNLGSLPVQGTNQQCVVRVYEHEWQTNFFQPAASVESRVTGNEVLLLHGIDLNGLP